MAQHFEWVKSYSSLYPTALLYRRPFRSATAKTKNNWSKSASRLKGKDDNDLGAKFEGLDNQKSLLKFST